MLTVVDAKYVGDYRIWLQFNTGEEGEVNLEDDLWGPVFEPLKNKEQFIQFEVSRLFKTIVWNNTADLAPEYLLSKLHKDSA